jgi:hypothetical protein
MAKSKPLMSKSEPGKAPRKPRAKAKAKASPAPKELTAKDVVQQIADDPLYNTVLLSTLINGRGGTNMASVVSQTNADYRMLIEALKG